MALFGDGAPTVPVAMVERFLDAMEKERERAHAITLEALAIKRHELQMPAPGWDPNASDPWNTLGPKTQLAIEEFAAGDPQLRNYLIGQATVRTAAYKSQHTDPEEADGLVGAIIQAGES